NLFDLSGLLLTRLKITQGASETVLRFDTPNPGMIEDFTFTTGASSAKLFGLGNANFKRMTMSSGAGDYTLDFTGTLLQDTQVDIKAGISNITIIIPAEMRAVVINQGTVSNVNSQGTWLLTDQTYTTLNQGYTLTINLDMSVGNVNLIHEE
ncbi:MAG: cell wall-active antibiotics response protein, partial [Brevefilum sp.]|nr:cell wall-active antibiotics response protein [Brevefilum sp.]